MMKTIPNPEFIKTYAELFVESRIMEKIIPREVTQADELESFNPYLIRDTVTEKLVPEGTSPYVGSDLTGINRVSKATFKIEHNIFTNFYSFLYDRVLLTWFMISWIAEARDGGQ